MHEQLSRNHLIVKCFYVGKVLDYRFVGIPLKRKGNTMEQGEMRQRSWRGENESSLFSYCL